MAVKLRLVRMGRRNRSFFRLRVGDERYAPTGRFLEEVGYVNPHEKDREKGEVIDRERVEYWLSKGAKTSETVASMLKRHGIGAAAAPADAAASA